MKIYTAEHALTTGIEELEAQESSCTKGMMVVGTPASVRTRYLHKEGRGWFRTYEEAAKRAESKRIQKIKTLELQLERLKALRF